MNPESSISQVEAALKPCYQSAGFYDLLNRQKDYAAEVAYLAARIEQHKQAPGNRLLDVACGTGQHIYFLQTSMKCEGLDIDSEFLDICTVKLPGMKFHLGDMTNFQLPDKFDVVTCLFSSIGYVKTFDLLLAAKRYGGPRSFSHLGLVHQRFCKFPKVMTSMEYPSSYDTRRKNPCPIKTTGVAFGNTDRKRTG
jgi:SAM-dependent methyltransferase